MDRARGETNGLIFLDMATTTKEISIGDLGARSGEHETELQGETMALNVGPSHPTTHGVLRLKMELDGDVVKSCDPVLGYLHRGDEKIAENMTYNQFIPYTDRLDYLAPLAKNVAYAMAVKYWKFLSVVKRSVCYAVNWRALAPAWRGRLRYGCGRMDSIHVYFHRA